MPALAVVDTNVVVSGLLTADGASPVAVVLDGMLTRRFGFLLSTDLVAEYRAVLLRPRVRARHGLAPAEVEQLLVALALEAVWRDPPTVHAAGALGAAEGRTPAAPDPGDAHLWALLTRVPGSLLVTGDALLVAKAHPAAAVVTPRAFVDALARHDRA